MENWTLPDAQDLLGRNQMQGPPLLGTTQYVTKQSYTSLTTNGANTVALTRKGNMLRKWILVTRGGTTIEGHSPRVALAGVAGDNHNIDAAHDRDRLDREHVDMEVGEDLDLHD